HHRPPSSAPSWRALCHARGDISSARRVKPMARQSLGTKPHQGESRKPRQDRSPTWLPCRALAEPVLGGAGCGTHPSRSPRHLVTSQRCISVEARRGGTLSFAARFSSFAARFSPVTSRSILFSARSSLSKSSHLGLGVVVAEMNTRTGRKSAIA